MFIALCSDSSEREREKERRKTQNKYSHTQSSEINPIRLSVFTFQVNCIGFDFFNLSQIQWLPEWMILKFWFFLFSILNCSNEQLARSLRSDKKKCWLFSTWNKLNWEYGWKFSKPKNKTFLCKFLTLKNWLKHVEIQPVLFYSCSSSSVVFFLYFFLISTFRSKHKKAVLPIFSCYGFSPWCKDCQCW